MNAAADVFANPCILLCSGGVVESFEESLQVLRNPHREHVAAVLGILIKTGLDRIISSEKIRALSLIFLPIFLDKELLQSVSQ